MFSTKLRNESGILIAVDFLKAFDSLEFSLFWKLSSKMDKFIL